MLQHDNTHDKYVTELYDSKIGRYKRALTALQHLQENWPHSVDLARRAIDVRKKIVDLQLQRSEF